MPHKKYALTILCAALLLSSCKMTYPQSGAAPTLSPFTQPFPTGIEPMSQVEALATGSAIAKTATAAAEPFSTPTATATSGGVTNSTETATPDILMVTATSTPDFATEPIPSAPSSITTPTPTLRTGRPATYILQSGEHPYCIARRFNVDPDDLLALSGLTREQADSLPAGTVLKIPQSGVFPGERALRPHPTTYTVTSANETFYSIACLFGDVDPAAIAQANGLALNSPLTIGQAIKIP